MNKYLEENQLQSQTQFGFQARQHQYFDQEPKKMRFKTADLAGR